MDFRFHTDLLLVDASFNCVEDIESTLCISQSVKFLSITGNPVEKEVTEEFTSDEKLILFTPEDIGDFTLLKNYKREYLNFTKSEPGTVNSTILESEASQSRT